MNEVLICRQDPAAWLHLSGEDAAAFLQGQFTNELRRNEARPVTYGLWLNQKGRVLADSFVLGRQPPAGFEIVSLSSPGATIRARLEAYIVADDVTIEDRAAGGMAGWNVVGNGALALLAAWGCSASLAAGEYATADGAVVWRARSAGAPNWYVCASGPDVVKWMERFDRAIASGRAQALGHEALAASRIVAGIPAIPAELGPGDLPNEGAIEAEAISFTKGCYLGQEVMARLASMGQVRRRLYVVQGSATDAALAHGRELFLGDRRVGDLRSVVRADDGWIGLAMLQRERVSDGATLSLVPDGPAPVVVRHVAAGRMR